MDKRPRTMAKTVKKGLIYPILIALGVLLAAMLLARPVWGNVLDAVMAGMGDNVPQFNSFTGQIVDVSDHSEG